MMEELGCLKEALNQFVSADNGIRQIGESSIDLIWSSSPDRILILLASLMQHAIGERDFLQASLAAVLFRRFLTRPLCMQSSLQPSDHEKSVNSSGSSTSIVEDISKTAWTVMDPSQREACRQQLLEIWSRPDLHGSLRMKLSDAISETARLIGIGFGVEDEAEEDDADLEWTGDNVWEDLVDVISRITWESSTSIITSAMRIVEAVPELLTSQWDFESQCRYLEPLMGHSDLSVRLASLRAFCQLLALQSDEDQKNLAVVIGPVISQMISQVIGSSGSDADASINDALAVLVMAVESSPVFFGNEQCALKMILSCLDRIDAGGSDVIVVELLVVSCEAYPLLLVSHSQRIWQSLANAMVVALQDDEDEDWLENYSEDEELSSMTVCIEQAMDRLASVAGKAAEFTTQFLETMQSLLQTNGGDLKREQTEIVALRSLTSVAEGLAESLSPHADQLIVQVVMPRLSFQVHPRVQYHAIHALGQMLSDLHVNSDRLEQLINAVGGLLKQSRVFPVVKNAMAVIINVMECIRSESELCTHVPGILQRHLVDVYLINHPKDHEMMTLLETQRLATVASVLEKCHNSKQKLEESFMKDLNQFLITTWGPLVSHMLGQLSLAESDELRVRVIQVLTMITVMAQGFADMYEQFVIELVHPIMALMDRWQRGIIAGEMQVDDWIKSSLMSSWMRLAVSILDDSQWRAIAIMLLMGILKDVGQSVQMELWEDGSQCSFSSQGSSGDHYEITWNAAGQRIAIRTSALESKAAGFSSLKELLVTAQKRRGGVLVFVEHLNAMIKAIREGIRFDLDDDVVIGALQCAEEVLMICSSKDMMASGNLALSNWCISVDEAVIEALKEPTASWETMAEALRIVALMLERPIGSTDDCEARRRAAVDCLRFSMMDRMSVDDQGDFSVECLMQSVRLVVKALLRPMAALDQWPLELSFVLEFLQSAIGSSSSRHQVVLHGSLAILGDISRFGNIKVVYDLIVGSIRMMLEELVLMDQGSGGALMTMGRWAEGLFDAVGQLAVTDGWRRQQQLAANTDLYCQFICEQVLPLTLRFVNIYLNLPQDDGVRYRRVVDHALGALVRICGLYSQQQQMLSAEQCTVILDHVVQVLAHASMVDASQVESVYGFLAVIDGHQVSNASLLLMALMRALLITDRSVLDDSLRTSVKDAILMARSRLSAAQIDQVLAHFSHC